MDSSRMSRHWFSHRMYRWIRYECQTHALIAGLRFRCRFGLSLIFCSVCDKAYIWKDWTENCSDLTLDYLLAFGRINIILFCRPTIAKQIPSYLLIKTEPNFNNRNALYLHRNQMKSNYESVIRFQKLIAIRGIICRIKVKNRNKKYIQLQNFFDLKPYPKAD